nr:zinc dependent phospholipase C family protein [Pseudomaricurvus sp. HS19]
MGPGIAIKAVLQGSFSLMVFGWAQIVMDIQPLMMMITGEGHLHGFSHTYVGATLLALFSALTGKYLSEMGLFMLGLNRQWQVKIAWWVTFVSAFIGTYTHVLLDSVMHYDVEPFYPFSTINQFQGLISIESLHKMCISGGAVGGVLYFAVQATQAVKKSRQQAPATGKRYSA